MKALVVVSELNSARTLKRCLDCLINQETHDDYRVWVIDGGSIDGSIEIIKSYPRGIYLKVIPGASEVTGQNFALSFASFGVDVILFTNSDCYVGKDWVRRHLSWHKNGYDMVGGKLFWGGDKYGFAWSYMTPDIPTNILTSGLSLGFSNCSLSMSLVKKVGLLKEMKAQQDMDFWIRAIKMGAKMALDPKIEVYHDHPMGSFRGSWLRAFYYGRNHVILLRAAFGRTRWPNYTAWPYSLQTLEELMLVRMALIWKQQRMIADKHGINPGLIRFVFLKMFAFKVATLFGWLMAMLHPVGKVIETEMTDAHRWGKTD